MASLALLVGVCVLVARSGLLARLRAALEVDRPRPWLASAVLAGALVLPLAAANSALAALAAWRVDAILARGGLSARPDLAADFAAAMSGVLPSTAAAILVAPPLFWLMRRLPRLWPMLVAPVLSALILAVVWLPYGLSLEPALGPAPPGPAQAGIVKLIAETGLPAHQVYLLPLPGFDGDVTGGLAAPKVVARPALLAAPASEARAYVGHLMGHYAHADILAVSLILAVAAAAGVVLIAAGSTPLAHLIGARGTRRAADPESLPAAAIILVLACYAAPLAVGGYLRWANVRADAFSLDHAREPDGLAAVLERTWDHDAIDPTPLETAVFYTHPPLDERIGHAMAWKAAHAAS